jgi:hypothetical protein
VDGDAPDNGAWLRYVGGGGGGGIGAFSKVLIRTTVSVVLTSSKPSDLLVVARHASKPVILSNICCIINWNPLNSSTSPSMLLAIFACSDGGHFFGASLDQVGGKKSAKESRLSILNVTIQGRLLDRVTRIGGI